MIQLSDHMDPANVRRAVAHEVAEILARRELALRGELPGQDVLGAGRDSNGPLSPHDHGRIAELVELARELRGGDAASQARAHDEMMALIDDMGLRQGMPRADERLRLVEAELATEGPASTAAREEVEKSRAGDSKLSEADAKKLAWMRDEAAADRKAQADFDRAHEPLHERPSTGRGRVSKAEAEALARKAHAHREARSAATLAKVRAENAAGKHPKWKLQIGGNAALAARDPAALLVDANQRWAVDSSGEIAQTAQQLEAIKAAGIGDPYEFADAHQRVPLAAVTYWQDSIAVQGPVIDGRAELGVGGNGKLIATIHPNDGSPAVSVEVDGVPMVATGFTHETAPGGWGMSPRQALIALDLGLAELSSDPKVGAAATVARAELAKLQGTDESDAGNALSALSSELRSRLVSIPDEEIATKARNAIRVLGASQDFTQLRAQDPGHVLYGDEANKLTEAQIEAMHRVVIAGTGGTGISAAEIILNNPKNTTVHVVMIGKDAPAGLTENDQFRSVVQRHGTKELCERFHFKPENPDGRFEFVDGYLLGAPERTGNQYDVNASPEPNRSNAEGTAHTSATPPPPEAAQGDTYIAAMGRSDDLPPAVAALVNQTERAGRKVTWLALLDDNRRYIGYRLAIPRPDGSDLMIDITGAASRFVDRDSLTDKERNAVKKANDHDVPQESGNFPGGYMGSADQSARYRAHRLAHPDQYK